MSVLSQIINGTNLNRDAGFSSLVSAYVKEGVRSNFGNDLAITLNQCDTGMAFVEVTRTSVTPNEVFLIPIWVDVAETIDTSGDGYIIIEVDQAKINDGSANNADGTGVATVKKVSSLPSSNYLELASLASGVITDTRVAMSIDIEKMIASEIEVDTISEKTADNGVLIDEILSKDGYFDTPEQAGNPSTPASTHWRLFFKADGLYQIDDVGAVSKFLSGASAPSINVTLGETISAGNCLRLKKDGKAYKTNGIPDVLAYNGSVFNFPMLWKKRISGTKYLFCRNESATYKLVIGTISSTGAWTFGASVILTGGILTANYPNTVSISSDGLRVISAYASGSNIIAQTFSISGNTITQIDASFNLQAITYDTQTVFSAFVQSSGGNYYYVAGGTRSTGQIYSNCQKIGTTTIGAFLSIATSNRYAQCTAIYNKEQQAILCWSDNSTLIKGLSLNQTINTTTVAIGTEQTIYTGTSTGKPRVYLNVTDTLLLTFDDSGLDIYISKITVSSNNPSGSESKIYDNVNGNSKIDLDYSGAEWSAITSNIHTTDGQPMPPRLEPQLAYIDISGSSPSYKYETIPLLTGGSSEIGIVHYGSSIFLVFSDQSLLWDGTNEYTRELIIDINDFIGWAGSGGVLNDVISCNIDRDSSQSGLITGQSYRLNYSGGLTTTGTGKIVAKALSTTEIIRLY